MYECTRTNERENEGVVIENNFYLYSSLAITEIIVSKNTKTQKKIHNFFNQTFEFFKKLEI